MTSSAAPPQGVQTKGGLNLELKPGLQSIRQQFRDLNPDMEARLQTQSNTWLEEEMMELSSGTSQEERWQCEVGGGL
ncbi:MAG: hypothetical protein GY696_18730 [Gammaproteobacteria bacterium]|nr:hypothetical protein [Gammaproteobacteria bacterium]